MSKAEAWCYVEPSDEDREHAVTVRLFSASATDEEVAFRRRWRCVTTFKRKYLTPEGYKTRTVADVRAMALKDRGPEARILRVDSGWEVYVPAKNGMPLYLLELSAG